MRLRTLLAGLILLLPIPAWADVTAHYSAGNAKLLVEAADNGDSRLSIDGPMKVAILHHAGIDYMVLADNAGVQRVTRADAVMTLLIGSAGGPDQPLSFKATQGASDSVAGFSGMLWTYGPGGEAPLELLMSADPRLAPIGNAFRGLVALVIGATGEMLNPAVLNPIFASGTPIRIRETDGDKHALIALESVSMDAIDPAHFALPGPVLSAADFLKLMPSPAPAPASTARSVEHQRP